MNDSLLLISAEDFPIWSCCILLTSTVLRSVFILPMGEFRRIVEWPHSIYRSSLKSNSKPDSSCRESRVLWFLGGN